MLLEDLEGAVALVRPQGREGCYLGLLAVVLEVHAIRLQEFHRGLPPVAVGDVHLLADLVRRFYPCREKLPAVTAPLGVEVHQRVVVEGRRRLE
eukprot:1105999-Pyramimonas_sp.AAC.1